MKILMIAFYTFLRHVRDVKAMIAFLLLPIAMMLILGAALNSEFTPKTIDPMKVGYLSQDEGMLSTAFDQFLKSEQVGSLLQVEEVADVEQGKQAVKSGELKGFIYLQANLSQQLQDGGEARIEFYSKDENSFVRPMLESFIRTYNLSDTLLKLDGKPVTPDLTASNIREVKIVTEGKIPRGIDYYSITMLFQSLLFGALFGIFAITKDLGNHTYSRLLAAPVHGSQVLLGKLIGSTLTLYAVSLFLFLVTKFVFKANWNADLWLILSVLFLFCAISVALGMILALSTRSTMISSLTLFIVNTVFTLVSGGFSPMEGKWIDTLSRLAPNWYGQKALFSDIYEGSILYSSLAGLVVYSGIAVLVVFISGRRRVA